ncbi:MULTISPECIES: ATP-binding protein [Citrobacter]|uniref:ATP-binding protein n=1 Tax=Citrobacter TaxID=544 RepID=UPI0018FF88A5|nr:MULTISPECIES: ATP-binding protein [Citrobacter]MBJ8886412.1 ATP-binding protein [Citrobacter sp. FDAARGOS_156]MCO4164658.1 ATP-binding protein [Citrobacter youngae]HED2481392.1 ATP-binding protein [Citrobacter youngae]
MARRYLGKKPFDLSARVPMQLGRESISSSTVAVSELIKNGYDADAESVHVEFFLRESPALSTLVIRDDGNGMDAETIYDHWLKIGTDFKNGVELSINKKRVLTGAKGLGRLGLDRLSKKVVLYTKKKGSNSVIQLIVDWRKYEETNVSISDIQHDIYEQDLPLSGKYGDIFSSVDDSGTYMVLIGLKDYWCPDFIEDLKQELRLLISPYRSNNDFSITIHRTINNIAFPKEVVDTQELLKAASWEVKAVIDSNNKVKLSFKNNTTGELIEQIPIPWKYWISKQGDKPLFGPLKFEFHYMVRKKEFLSKIDMSARNWSKFMELNRGVRIYRDDFRVRPYGEPTGKGDWLDLGYRKASSPGGIKQGGWRIAPNQIIGAVSISKTTNAILNDQANREGIVENEAYLQLRNFILKVISSFEVLATKDAQADDDTDLAAELERIIKEKDSDLKGAIDEIKAFSKKTKRKGKKVPPAQILNQKLRELERAKVSHQKALDDYYSYLEKERKKLEGEKDTLSNLASLGVLTVSFGHEIRTHSSLALNNAKTLKTVIQTARTANQPINYNQLISLTDLMITGAQYVDTFSRLAINNIKPDKRTRSKVNVPKIFKYIFDMMSVSFSKMGIQYNIEFVKIAEEDFNVRSFEIDWESIAINLITNATWALEDTPRDKRQIKIIFERVGGTRLRLAFMDSGCGLETGQENTIFLPMHSRKTDRRGNSIGTGMGLSIIKNQVEDHMPSGTITAQQHSDLGGAGFYIEVLQDK